MKKPAVGETDNLRALTDDPELRALMEQYYAVKPSEREPYPPPDGTAAERGAPTAVELSPRTRTPGAKPSNEARTAGGEEPRTRLATAS
jgi:hypothetical protein